MQKLLSHQRIRIFNLLTKHLKEDESLYGVNITKYEFRVQGVYNPRIVCTLGNKKFISKVNSIGYLTMTKIVAGLEISFTFTD